MTEEEIIKRYREMINAYRQGWQSREEVARLGNEIREMEKDYGAILNQEELNQRIEKGKK